jgi:hypothetical protein
LTSTKVSLLTSLQPEKRKVSLSSADVGAVHDLRTHAMGSEYWGDEVRAPRCGSRFAPVVDQRGERSV